MAGYKVISFDKIPSTQNYALDLVARAQASDHMAIFALAQSAGRGRYRRRWVSHHGNLYVSFIFDCPHRDARLSYAVAVAIAETLRSYGIDAKIKWPNDILINGNKVSGTLIEYAGDFVVVGIGINVNTNPTVPEYQTTKLNKFASDIQITDLLGRLMRNLDIWRGCDFDTVRNRWTEMAIGMNKVARYRGTNMELIGINDRGALILRDGTRYVLAWGDEITIPKI